MTERGRSEPRRSPGDGARTGAPSRRGLLLGAGGAAGAVAGGLSGLAHPLAAAAAATPAAAAPGGRPAALADSPYRDQVTSFVTSRRSSFLLDGRPWRFGGTNCYYLHQKSHYMVDSVLNDARAMGLQVVRAWAFADGTERTERALQPEPYVYDEEAFDSLDYAVMKAGQLGIRMVLPVVNNWDDYGGMAQYVQWFRGVDVAEAGGASHDLFYTDPEIQACFQAWVRHLVGRTNRYTGVRYVDDPAVMTWEVANEPRCRSDQSGRTLRTFVDRTSRLIARLAPRQMVAVGDEGFLGETGSADYPYSDYEGARWAELTNLPFISYGTLHLYPEYWKGDLSTSEQIAWGERYIRRHIDDRSVRKPVVLEEYGLGGAFEEAAPVWTSAVEDGGEGSQFWILTARQDDGTPYPDYDGHRVVYPSPVAELMTAHSARMRENPQGGR
ncbi:cellulase family glycosylhydrolase [uncultured Pseudokineococcus sp.]|uniref:glycoside hydrolase 5 family protein n=1 Tax=uncultured Pseudokineococcus sp. TaxID=1642928 RepID=UPI002603BC56|nr:cellulase family glycosylhydrolase [uncultured Pseudokineococcus sp.]